MKLTDAKLRNLATPGKHFDGGGLYLEITPAGGRYWRLKYRHGGKEKRLAFGVYPEVSLKAARERRADAVELTCKLRSIRRVDVDGTGRGGESTARQRERGADSKTDRFHGYGSYGEKERPC